MMEYNDKNVVPNQNNVKKVFLVSSSAKCKPNSVISARILKFFESNEYQLARDVRDANLVFVNTCACTQMLEDKTINLFRDIYKEKNEQAKVISVGCLNAINRKALEDRFSDLHILQNLSELNSITDTLVLFNNSKTCYYDKHLMDYASCDKHFSVMDRGVIIAAEILCRAFKTTRYPSAESTHLPQILDEIYQTNKACVQISSGCKGHCSYCIIKKAKGDLHSRKIDDILDDIDEMHQEGMIKDNTALNLVADDCACYGMDTGESLFSLVAAIHARFTHVPLEFCYVNPSFIVENTNAYLEMFQNVRINSINIPLQSGSDRIIQLMDRDYAVADVLGFVDQVKKISPHTMIWSHFIVGFPSETWKDFSLSLRSARRFHFYVPSTFSVRAGTKASGMTNDVSAFNAKIRYHLFVQQLIFQKACGLLIPKIKNDVSKS